MATSDDLKSLDTALAFDTWSTAVVHACTRRLVDYDAAGKLQPDLAEKWEIQDGGKSYCFTLGQGIQYADGSPIQAAHFVAALARVRDPKTASPGAAFFSGIASVDAPDPGTLVVKLKAPDPTLLNLMGLTFAAPLKPGQDSKLPSPSGPYQVEEYLPGEKVTLARNPHSEAAKAWVEKIVVQLKVAEALQMTRFQSGEVDLLPAVPAAELARLAGDAEAQKRLVRGVVPQTWYFGMNVTRAPWTNPKVRAAAALALDRERIVQLAGGGTVANGILPPGVPGYRKERPAPARDVDGAKKLLADAGFPGGLPPGKPITLWLASNEKYQRLAEAIQSDLKEVGIPVELKSVVLSEYLSGYRTKADCWFGGWYPDFPDAGNFLEPVLHGRSVPPKGSNAAHYRNTEVDGLLDRAHAAPLGAEREALYGQAEDRLLSDAPWAPLYFEEETRYARDGIQGITVHPVWRQILTGIRKGGA